MSDWGDEVIHHKYDPLPDEPRYRKKSKKKRVRSDHKHVYENVAVDTHSYVIGKGTRTHFYYVCKRCKVCGRLGSSTIMAHGTYDPPDDMPLYEVDDIFEWFDMKMLPEEKRVR